MAESITKLLLEKMTALELKEDERARRDAECARVEAARLEREKQRDIKLDAMYEILVTGNGSPPLPEIVRAHDEYIKDAKVAKKEATKSWIAIGMLFVGQVIQLIFNAFK